MSAEPTPQAELRDYLAAERTFLAWVRTGLALMGFGFVVARFGLFLQQLAFVQQQTVARSYGLSLWFGTGLIAVGIIVTLASVWRHIRLIRDLSRGAPPDSRPSALALGIAGVLALVGLAMMIYLLSIRRSERSLSANTEEAAVESILDNGLTTKPSAHSVDQTVDKLKTILRAKGVTLFALVDHSGEAAKVGMDMPPTKLLIFGNPQAGTPLMLAAPSSAIDLPLKILVWQDRQDKVWITYNSAEYLQKRHGLAQELLPNVAIVETLAAKAGQ